MMRKVYENILWKVLENELSPENFRQIKAASLSKTAFQNPLTNPHWAGLIDGALKGLEFVAIASLDWKLTAIVKLFQSWIKDKREEKEQKDREETHNMRLLDKPQPGYGGTYY